MSNFKNLNNLKTLKNRWMVICALLLLCANSVLADDNAGGVYLGASSVSSLGCTPETVDPLRGFTVGCTFFESQKLGSMGRQIEAIYDLPVLNFVWTNQASVNSPFGRNVRVDQFDPLLAGLVSGLGGQDIGADLNLPNRAEYVSVATTSGYTLTAFDWNRNFGAVASKFYTNVFIFGAITLGIDIGGEIDTLIGLAQLPGNATVFRYPQIAYTDNGGPASVTHVTLSSDATDVDNAAFYARRVGIGTWESSLLPAILGYAQSIVITASRQSQRVAIAWSGGRGDGTPGGASVSRYNGQLSGKNDNDIYVMISEDAGASWSEPTNVTLRQAPQAGDWAPHGKLSLLFDGADNLHVVWQATQWPGYPDPRKTQFTSPARMFHWNESSNIVQTAVDANWNPSMCNGGANTLNLDNPQLSWCNDKLYLTFTQFAPVPLGRGDDCSERGFSGDALGSANGDIFLAVSADGGASWDYPRNLTDTYTPNCDTLPGGALPDCDSDVWHSATRYGIDITGDDFVSMPDFTNRLDVSFTGVDYLFAQYISDSDPGAAVRSEGGWTNNSVLAFRFGCVDAVSGAVLASSLPEGGTITGTGNPATDFGIQGDTTLSWILENIGDVDINDLSVAVINDDPPGNIVVSGFGSTLLSGNSNALTGSITLNATVIDTFRTASADVVANGTFAGSPKTFSFNYTIFRPGCCDVAGDANNSGSFGIADITFIIAYIFSGGSAPPCCEEADANGDGRVNISDATFLLAYMFRGGQQPVCESPEMDC